MKENVLDVLIYLFDNVFDTESEVETDQETLTDELEAAGFEKGEIDKAFNWLEGLHFAQARTESVRVKTMGGVRIYTPEELDRISAECRGFLLTMEECGVIDAQLREMIVERVMALESVQIDLTQLKWVILMVLCNSNREDGPSVEWVEEVMLGDFTETMH